MELLKMPTYTKSIYPKTMDSIILSGTNDYHESR